MVRLRVIGPASDAKQLWRWLGRSAFASTRAPGGVAVGRIVALPVRIMPQEDASAAL